MQMLAGQRKHLSETDVDEIVFESSPWQKQNFVDRGHMFICVCVCICYAIWQRVGAPLVSGERLDI